MSKKVGVVLSGCGFLDGAEIHESVLTMLHLDAAGAEIICAAPQKAQHHVVNHASGDPAEAGQERDVLEEAARIARGKIRPLNELNADELDAVIFPGGFGAAKNLSSFAFEGADCSVDEEVVRVMRSMQEQKKPIGVICISPAVCAAVFKGTDVKPTLTIGEDEGTAGALESMGARHQEAPVTGIVVDETNLIVSTPAYMFDARVSDVSQGIEKLVETVLSFA